MDSFLLLLLVLISVMVLLLMVVRPVFALMPLLSFAFVHPSLLPVLMKFGGLSVRYADIFSGLLACIILMQLAIQRDIAVLQDLREFYVPLVPFLLYTGVSLANIGFSQPHLLTISVSSYLRLIATSLLAPLVALTIKDDHDMKVFHMLLIVCSIIAVAFGAWEGWSTWKINRTPGGSQRFGGLLGVDILALISGLLVLHALSKGDEKAHVIQQVILLACGLLGLILGKSAGSILATAGVSTLYLGTVRPSRRGTLGLFRWVAIGTVMMIVGALAIWTLRQSDVMGLTNVSSGSFAHRFMMAQAGLWIFLDHPFIGVGWQASAQGALSSPDLNTALMKRFPELPKEYFFSENMVSFHNMSIQFLAELGIIGYTLFVYACFRIGKATVMLTRSLRDGSLHKAWARFYAFSLVFLLIWWNTTPLYGGQTESLLAFISLGVLATVARLKRSEEQGR